MLSEHELVDCVPVNDPCGALGVFVCLDVDRPDLTLC